MNSHAAGGGGGASWCDCSPPTLCSTVVVFITFTFFRAISADQSRILTHKQRLSETPRILPDACRVPQHCLVPPPSVSLFETFISPFDLKKCNCGFCGFVGLCGAARDGVVVLSARSLKQQPGGGTADAAAAGFVHSAVCFLHSSVLLSVRAEVAAPRRLSALYRDAVSSYS